MTGVFRPIVMGEDTSEVDEDELWIRKIASGTTPLNAGLELGWWPKKIEAKMTEYGEMVSTAQLSADGDVIKALHHSAVRGNISAIQMWLFNRRPAEWRDVKRIVVSGSAEAKPDMVQSTKMAALELLRENGIVAMQDIEISSE